MAQNQNGEFHGAGNVPDDAQTTYCHTYTARYSQENHAGGNASAHTCSVTYTGPMQEVVFASPQCLEVFGREEIRYAENTRATVERIMTPHVVADPLGPFLGWMLVVFFVVMIGQLYLQLVKSST